MQERFQCARQRRHHPQSILQYTDDIVVCYLSSMRDGLNGKKQLIRITTCRDRFCGSGQAHRCFAHSISLTVQLNYCLFFSHSFSGQYFACLHL